MQHDNDESVKRLEPEVRDRLSKLGSVQLPEGSVLFRPGDDAKGFVLVKSGRIAVYLTGRTGREILLYTIESGGTCIQTTLGILGGQHYTGEAVAETEVEFTLIPRSLFLDLMEHSESFRRFVFRAFAERMADVTRVLEQVAFVRIENRIASTLLDRAEEDGSVHLTHQQIATAIGSAREVVSRRLEIFAAQGLVTLDRGRIKLADTARLQMIAQY